MQNNLSFSETVSGTYICVPLTVSEKLKWYILYPWLVVKFLLDLALMNFNGIILIFIPLGHEVGRVLKYN